MEERLPITVLYVEDDLAIREAVGAFLELFCCRVMLAENGAHGRRVSR